MNNDYRFYVRPMTGDAVNKLNELNKIMDSIESKSAKGTQNFLHTTQKEIDEAIREMQRLIAIKKDLDRAFDDDLSMSASVGDSEGIIAAKGNMEQLRRTTEETAKTYDRLVHLQRQPNNINRQVINEQKAYQTELSESEKAIKSMRSELGEMQRAASRAERAVGSATSTGRMTFKQAQRLRGDLSSEDTVQERLQTARGRQQDNFNKRRVERENLAGVAKDPTLSETARKAEESAIYDRIAQLDKENKVIKNVTDTYEELLRNLRENNRQMQSTNVQVDPDQQSFLGVMNSRAPSIAMASIGAFAGAFGGLYAKGGTAVAGMRDQSISIGQRTGAPDFRAMRKEMQRMGVDRSLGYAGADMLQFQDDALSNMGLHDDLVGSTEALAKGSRAVPVDNEVLSDFMNQNMRNGAISGKDQIKAIQEGFLGAIQQSGMVGREKESLEALKGLSAQVFSGREGSTEELKNIMAMQSMLDGTGNRAVQGEAGGELLSSLDAGMKGIMGNQKSRLVNGFGTKFKHTAGYYQMSQQVEKGIADPENFRNMMAQASKYGDGTTEANDRNKGALMMVAKDFYNTNLTSKDADGLFEAFGDGKLSDEALEKRLKEQEIVGKTKYDENGNAYTDSNEATDNASEATTELKATEINDMGTFIRKANIQLGKLPGLLYALSLSLIATTTAIAGSGMMSLGSSFLKGKTTTTFAQAAKATPVGSVASTVGNAWKAGKGAGGTMGGFKGVADLAKNTAGAAKTGYQANKMSGVKDAMKGIFSVSDDAASAAGAAGKGAGAFSKGLSALAWLGIGSSAITGYANSGSDNMIGKIDDAATNVISSSGQGWFDKDKGVGSKILDTAGTVGNGAIVGSKVAPGVGTLIGGILGLVGGILGEENMQKDATKNGSPIQQKQKALESGRNDNPFSRWFFGQDAPKNPPGVTTPDELDEKGKKDKEEGGIGKTWKNFTSGVSKFFNGDEAEASEIDPTSPKGQQQQGTKTQAKNEDKADVKEDKDTANKKVLSEKNRESNNSKEDDNLSFYSKLLDRASKILNQARAQNGIFGNAGYGGGGSDGDSGEMGESSGKEYNGEWKEAIKDAGKQMNVDLTDKDVNDILRLIEKESGGDEKVMQQVIDENTTNGSGGAKGLLQYIQSTFDAYKVDGHGDILNGYDQLVAFLNNTNWRKDLDNWDARMAQGITGWGPSGGKRYAMGGKVDSPTQALIGEVPGQEEYIINPKQPTAPRLLRDAISATGENFNMGGAGGAESGTDWAMRIASINLAGAGGSGGGGGAVSQTLHNTNDIQVTITVSGNDSSTDIANKVGQAVGAKIASSASEALDFFSKEWKRR